MDGDLVLQSHEMTIDGIFGAWRRRTELQQQGMRYEARGTRFYELRMMTAFKHRIAW